MSLDQLRFRTRAELFVTHNYEFPPSYFHWYDSGFRLSLPEGINGIMAAEKHIPGLNIKVGYGLLDGNHFNIFLIHKRALL